MVVCCAHSGFAHWNVRQKFIAEFKNITIRGNKLLNLAVAKKFGAKSGN